jgi:hypothetical protein
MKFTTKLFTLGVIGAATYGAVRAFSRNRRGPVDTRFDASDIRDTSAVGDATQVGEPMIVTEAVVVLTDDDPSLDDLFAPDSSRR